MKTLANLLKSTDATEKGGSETRALSVATEEDRAGESNASVKWGVRRARSMRRIIVGDEAGPSSSPRPLSIRRISEVAIGKVRTGMANLTGASTVKKRSSMRQMRRATSKDEQQLLNQHGETGDDEVRKSSARMSGGGSHSPELDPVNVQAGGASCKGKHKQKNEDRLTVLAHLVQDESSTKSSVGFAAVLDGHGGDRCVEHVSRVLPTHIGHEIFQVMKEFQTDHWETVTRAAMTRGILSMDREYLQLANVRRDVSGSCAVMVTVRGCEVTVANVGDCRAVVYPFGEPKKAKSVTTDHTVTNTDEINRIRVAGGKIIENRLAGVLSPTRAFGDADLKEESTSGLVVDPEVYYFVANPGAVLILCSDGVTSAFSNEEISEIIQREFDSKGIDPSLAAATLCKRASDISTDDSSALIILFQSQMDENPL